MRKNVADPSAYRSWQMMKNRCCNPRALDWRHYGGRGIHVCVRWLNYDNFIADMGPKPTPLHTLERKDGDRGYYPENCEWATRETQSRNRDYTKLSLEEAFAIRRDPRAQKEIAADYGVSQTTVSLVKRGVYWRV